LLALADQLSLDLLQVQARAGLVAVVEAVQDPL
jgi:hypothetical protein